jgi:hypothetical protein
VEGIEGMDRKPMTVSDEEKRPLSELSTQELRELYRELFYAAEEPSECCGKMQEVQQEIWNRRKRPESIK